MRLIWILLFITLTCCVRKKTEYSYYPDGSVMVKQEVTNGKKDGTYLEYYQNGTIKAKQNWTNGLPNGDFEDYYPNGQLRKKAHVEHNKMISQITYFESGKVFQIQKFDSNGIINDVERYTLGGVRDSVAIHFRYIVDGDTVKLGKPTVLKVLVLNRIDPVYKNGSLIITSGLDTLSRIPAPIDTLRIIHQRNTQYDYSFIPNKIGENVINGIFVYPIEEENHIITYRSHPFRYTFYVIK